jgi:hypothetical protein
VSERRLWQRMREGIAPFCFAQRIENSAGEGVPDVWLCSKITGEGAWIELKARELAPVRSITPVFNGSYGLRPAQVAWIHGRASAGAAIWVLAQCGAHVWLVHGRHARELAGWSLLELDCKAEWQGLARATDWEGMLAVALAE